MNQDVMNCPECNRRTPCARAMCLYCGASLPVTKIDAAPTQRNIDSSELAFNTVIEPNNLRDAEGAEAALASALKIEQAEARAFIAQRKPLPVARSQTRHEAELIAALIRTCGPGAVVVGDEDLMLEIEIARARRVSVIEGEIRAYHSGGVITIAPGEIKLMVVGRLKNTRVDYTEGIAGRRGQTGAALDSAEFRSEETLLDVYAAGLDSSFRIKADAFDYSSLVRPMSFRAEMNFQSALEALSAAAPQAIIDNDFARVRQLLARAWPERTRIEARGVKRAGIALRPVAQSSLISDNRDQFERYSRLMFLSAIRQSSSPSSRD